ncbi:hypothetical protein [Bradyrhizobium sp. S3.5.5]|uniref:hypothetical protein n=1 Tax=Bradyrhizobium sp. S3.5.5 TaxID=3156430 RepID=UPI003391925B
MARKPEDTSHLRLRIDPIRLAKLEKSAFRNGRTLTGEITHRLDESFKRDDLAGTLERLSDQVTVKVVAALKGDDK